MEKLLEFIDEEIEKNENAISEIDKTWDFRNKKWDEYEKEIRPFSKNLSKLSRDRRMIMPVELCYEINKDDHVMSLSNFINNVKGGGFIDYDGSGNYVKDGKITNITIYPSDVKHDSIRPGFDTIVWYNR